MVNYGLIYTIPFTTIKGSKCVIEISKADYKGEVIELVAGSRPFVVEIDTEDFLYTPTRFSTATIQVVGSDYMKSIFSSEYQQYRVTLKINNEPSWCGFVKPELYTQDYTSEKFILEIECISAMSSLEYIDYTTFADNETFVSIWDVLKKCIILSYGEYSSVYIPHVYASDKASYTTSSNVLAAMEISEHNFFDEDNKPMKMNEVLSEICQFLGWTCADWKGELYFVDIDHLGIYHKYDIQMTEKMNAYSNKLNVQNIGFSGSDHTLDILSGYNKVTVRCSNYPVGKIFADENFDELTVLDVFDSGDTDNSSGADYSTAHNLILQPLIYKAYHYTYNEYDLPEWDVFKGWKEITDDGYKTLSAENKYHCIGATLLKRCVIPFKNGAPSIYNYDYKNRIRIVPTTTKQGIGGESVYVLPIGKPLIELGHDLPCAFYINGAISINATISRIGKSFLDKIFQPIIMYFEVKIGDMYYDGSKWVRGEINFGIEFENENENFEKNNPIKINNTKTLDMPYNGSEGYIIPIKGIGLTGIPRVRIVGFYARGKGDFDYPKYQEGCFIESIELKFHKEDTGLCPQPLENEIDRIYENNLNEKYINEIDNINLRISSYNNDGVCYGKVVVNNYYLTDNLYNSILDKQQRPEELLITRIVNHYGATKFKLTQIIKNSFDISPLSVLTDSFFPSKKFINIGGSIDYHGDSFECIMLEI